MLPLPAASENGTEAPKRYSDVQWTPRVAGTRPCIPICSGKPAEPKNISSVLHRAINPYWLRRLITSATSDGLDERSNRW